YIYNIDDNTCAFDTIPFKLLSSSTTAIGNGVLAAILMISVNRVSGDVVLISLINISEIVNPPLLACIASSMVTTPCNSIFSPTTYALETPLALMVFMAKFRLSFKRTILLGATITFLTLIT